MSDTLDLERPAVAASPKLDTKRIDRELDIDAAMREAADIAGTTFAQQSRDMVRLRRGEGGIDPREYYLYRLYDRSLYDEAARAAFLGRWRLRRLMTSLAAEPLRVTCDKIVTQDRLDAAGIPVPRTLAIFGKVKVEGERSHIADLDDLRRVVQAAPPAGLFGKPVNAVNSLGVVSIDGLDAASDTLRLADGGRMRLAQLFVDMQRFECRGYLFQERLLPHPDVERAIGRRIGTCRVLVANGETPKVVRVAWKIPTGANAADNFWRPGNLLAAVDPATGRVLRVVDDIHPRLQEVEHHPNTGTALVGFQLPDWPELLETARRASRVMADLPLLGWDMALTDHGPIAVEVEGNGGHPMMVQLAHGRGLLEEPEIVALLERARQETPGILRLLLHYVVKRLLRIG